MCISVKSVLTYIVMQVFLIITWSQKSCALLVCQYQRYDGIICIVVAFTTK